MNSTCQRAVSRSRPARRGEKGKGRAGAEEGLLGPYSVLVNVLPVT